MYVHIDLDGPAGTLRVSGHGLPTVELRRDPGAATDRLVPIGTRDPARLTLTVAGEPALVRPAKGRLSRRSYRVDAVLTGTRSETRYRLVPCSYGESRLSRDGRPLGTLESAGDGRVDADWTCGVTPRDQAVGTALAAAFGTGAQPWWQTAADIVAELIP
ncbi:hypothetical protein ACFY7C_27215 [Streptomyces sp. NPDC012769]|uniref:hypothetical protein n=1 Tax=Streptomyces sp. NPDC012769 TaxID=3364848 RepID=UPI0036880952